MKYWKVLRYCIDRKYNPRYPLHAIVLIRGEPEEHFWMLPQECIGSEDYDWSKAVRTNNIWKEE